MEGERGEWELEVEEGRGKRGGWEGKVENRRRQGGRMGGKVGGCYGSSGMGEKSKGLVREKSEGETVENLCSRGEKEFVSKSLNSVNIRQEVTPVMLSESLRLAASDTDLERPLRRV
jgi:hypothetical protein